MAVRATLHGPDKPLQFLFVLFVQGDHNPQVLPRLDYQPHPVLDECADGFYLAIMRGNLALVFLQPLFRCHKLRMPYHMRAGWMEPPNA